MKHHGAAAALIVAVVALAGCTQGEGPVVDQSRDVGAFRRIEAGAGVHVAVTIGASQPIVVRAQDNIQDRISAGVRDDGTLRIEANDDFTVAEPVVVEVVTPSLDAVSLSGGAGIEIDGLDADAFVLALSGGARAAISGTVNDLTVTAKGGSEAVLSDLVAGTVRVDLDGGSSAELQATGSVSGVATGGARLRVAGDASLDVDTSGGAEVSRG